MMKLHWLLLAILATVLSKQADLTDHSYDNQLLTKSLHRFVCRNGLNRRTEFKGSPHCLGLLLMLSGDICTNPGPNPLMASANVRSIRRHYTSVLDFISIKNIDIFCASETWLTNNETSAFTNEITPPNHKIIHKPRIGKRGGGVAIFADKNLDLVSHDTPLFTSFETVMGSVTFSNTKINIVSVYRPPSSKVSVFLDEFSDFLSFLCALPTPFTISGDFNIHLDVKSTTSNEFLELLESCNLIQHVNFPTHIHGHTLDLFISQSDTDFIKTVQPSDYIVDHASIIVTLDTSTVLATEAKRTSYRSYHKINQDNFKQDILDSDLHKHPLNITTPGSLYQQYHDTLSSLLNKHAPLKSGCPKKRPGVPLNPKIIQAKKDKRHLERKWRQCKSPYNRSRFRQQINHCNNLIRAEKYKLYSEKISAASNDPKKLWKELNHILNKSPAPALPKHDSLPPLVETFSSFFLEKIDNIRAKFTDDINPSPGHATQYTAPGLFQKFQEVSENEIAKLIKSSPVKSSSLDPIPTFLLLDCLDVLTKPITTIINLCLAHGVFPDQFKLALVSPLLKKPSLSKEELKNYRPVSNLNYMSKLLERVVARQLNNHLQNQNLVNTSQSAYKAGHSTESALLKIKNDIHMSIAQGHCVALTLLDLSAAFDTIDHNILLNRLSTEYGISDVVLRWFISYLTDRKQAVKIQDTLSSERNLPYGVPQGSVLGPVLFTLYTTPLSKIISAFSSLSHHLYADDTQIYVSLKPQTCISLIKQLQDCLLAVQSWMATNKLKLNPDKTEFIVLGTETNRSRLSNFFPVDILGNTCTPTSKVKNLGVVFDSSLSMSKHVSQICSSCFYHIRDFRRIRRFLSKSVSITLANALVTSRIDYCNALLYGISAKQSRRLQLVQNTLCRIINHLPKYSRISRELKLLHWLPVKQRITFKILVFTYKALHTHQPPYISSLLNPYSCNRQTRRSNPDNKYLHTPRYQQKIHKSRNHFDWSFEIAAPSLWNSLPPHVRTAPSLSSFRSQLKGHLFTLAFPP